MFYKTSLYLNARYQPIFIAIHINLANFDLRRNRSIKIDLLFWCKVIFKVAVYTYHNKLFHKTIIYLYNLVSMKNLNRIVIREKKI